MKKIYIIIVLGLILILGIGFYWGYRSAPTETPEITLSSVASGGEYRSTTIIPSSDSTILIKSGQGTLGSVIFPITSSGYLTFYNATTSNVSLRTGNTATSSLEILAAFPASAAVGTYTFDIAFVKGLLLSYGGTISTTTITYR